jgi:hypothetical protein
MSTPRFAAAAVLAVGVALLAGCGASASSSQTSAPPAPSASSSAVSSPTSPTSSATGSPFAVSATKLTPKLTVSLPAWASTSKIEIEDGAYNYSQTMCGDSECAPNTGRGVRLYTVRFMYPLDSSTVRKNPSYAAEVAAYKDVQRLGYGTVSDVGTTTVGGRPATQMTVALTKEIYGLARCPDATSARGDCAHAVAGRVQRVTIIDNGRAQPVTLLFESWNRSVDADDSAVVSECQAWLSTVAFA